MSFIHQLAGWPTFTWQAEQLESLLGTVRNQQGRLLGRLDALGVGLREEATLRALTLDAVESSAIEGEILPPESVRSLLARRLGLDAGGLTAAPDRRVEGMVDLLLNATQHYDQLLTAERLRAWQAALFPTGRSGLYPVQVGAILHAAGRFLRVLKSLTWVAVQQAVTSGERFRRLTKLNRQIRLW